MEDGHRSSLLDVAASVLRALLGWPLVTCRDQACVFPIKCQNQNVIN